MNVSFSRLRAFTLVELLVVIAIIVVMTGFAVPIITSIGGAGDLTGSVYSVAGTLEQARAYAMANNTYVFVGITEVDASASASASPQSSATATAGGRVAMAVVASRDGTKQYQDATSSQGSDWQANYKNGANLVAVSKLVTLSNLHLASLLPTPTAGPMNRPAATTTPDNYVLGNAACLSQTPFTWPLGSGLSAGQYRFDKVIQFDPQGVARITTASNGNSIARWMEADFLPTHGNVIPATPQTAGVGNQAAIQINGITGSVRIYRP